MTDTNTFEAWSDGDGNVIVAERDPEVFEAASNAGNNDELWATNSTVGRAIASWAEDVQGGRPSRWNETIFERDRYVTPSGVYDQMKVAYEAVDDDIVSNSLDTTESLAFNRIRAVSEDEDQQNVWNQILSDLELDSWIRQAWREMFTVSHYYGVRWWGTKNYKVEAKRQKRAARKEFNILVPTKLGFLDPLRVVPVKPNVFGDYKLAWQADDGDMALYDDVKANAQSDDVVSSLFVSKYKPSETEESQLKRQGVNCDRLLLLSDEFVWMHSATKMPYERWPRVRMKSLFPILDLKTQLRSMDRAVLLSGTNFIVLVKKGTDALPVRKNAELDLVLEQVRTISKSPVIVSDHRLNIEIITPEIDHVLNAEKWDILDSRISMRLLGTFVSNPTEGQDTSLTLGRVIARGIASRRHMIKRDIEKNIVRPVAEVNEKTFDASAKIEFTPQRIELEMDEAIAGIIQELRDRGDISRETTLNELGFDQEVEAMRREREDEKYEEVFTPPTIPFDSPNKVGAPSSTGTPSGDGRKAAPSGPEKKV